MTFGLVVSVLWYDMRNEVVAVVTRPVEELCRVR
jgi:hypothetical protein